MGFMVPANPDYSKIPCFTSSLSGSVELPPGNEECDDLFWKNSMLLPLPADPLCVEVAPLRHFLKFFFSVVALELTDLQRGNVH